MRNSSESEEDDVHESQDEHPRGNKSKCVCECCAIANWEGQQEKECLCCKEIEEAVNKISGEYNFCIQQMLIILALGR